MNTNQSKIKLFTGEAYNLNPKEKRKSKLNSHCEKPNMVEYTDNRYRLWKINLTITSLTWKEFVFNGINTEERLKKINIETDEVNEKQESQEIFNEQKNLK